MMLRISIACGQYPLYSFDMAKSKKKPVDERQRQAILLDQEWHEVIRKLAAAAHQPIKWYLIEMLTERAKAGGIETPPAPWESAS